MFPARIHLASALSLIFLSAPTFAGNSPEDIKQRIGTGDPIAGKEKSALCQGCHGEDGNSATPDFPKLAGQYAVYIQKQINDFKSGARKDPIMTDMAATITDPKDLLDISAYFASQPQMKGASPVVNKSGMARFNDSNGCAECHGVNGKGLAPNSPSAPVIGGQHKEYIVKQLKDFKTGARRNEASGIMAMYAGMLSDAAMDDVASYAAGL